MASSLASSTLTASRPVVSFRPRVAAPVPSHVVCGTIGPGKNWESYELTKNGKPVRKPLHVKTGDLVVVTAGNDKGKTGKIVKVNRKTGEIMMDGINMSTRHMKASTSGESGEIVQKESPFHHSNVMHWSEKEQTRSRVGMRIGADGKKVRYLKKTDEVLAN